jgi:hypothetical protein
VALLCKNGVGIDQKDMCLHMKTRVSTHVCQHTATRVFVDMFRDLLGSSIEPTDACR